MARKRILIASDATDPHSAAVAFALRKKGHDCEILYTPDFPTLSLHVDPQDRTNQLLMRGPDVLQADGSQLKPEDLGLAQGADLGASLPGGSVSTMMATLPDYREDA